VSYGVLQCVAACAFSRSPTILQVCGVLRGVAVCCSVLQCVAVCCSVLQCVAVCAFCVVLLYCRCVVCCNVLHGVAVHCSVW